MKVTNTDNLKSPSSSYESGSTLPELDEWLIRIVLINVKALDPWGPNITAT